MWATVMPSLAVPLSLVATFAFMYVGGYSIDNISLMGLTISVGFIVDDAIVMIENIVRYIEQGMRPFDAALKGAGQIGFTIISITFSLIAVFIPLLFMGGIIGRLFREFAVTISVAVVASAAISLTLTPVMCSLFLRQEGLHPKGRFSRGSERVLQAALRAYDRGLIFIFRHQFSALLATLLLMVATGYLYVKMPKGFFPQQDTGFIFGELDVRQDSSVSAQVPLSTFAHFTRKSEPLLISHQGIFPAVTLSFNLTPGVSLGQAVSAIQDMTERLQVPPTLNTSFAGTAQAFQASLSSMPLLLAAAILVVYIVLGVLYESYIHPITILSALPSAGVGALLALMLLHYDLSVIAIVGIVLLIGIVKKNAIMIIDFALQAARIEGKSPQEAIHQACLLRFRPIMMTTFAALFGAVPIAFGTGGGAELRQPLGVAIIGGLLVSQWLTLYTTPVIYLYLERLSRWLGGAYRPSRVADALGSEKRAEEQQAAE